MSKDQVALTEVFTSFQGEGRWTLTPMHFIRLAGCPVGCPFCDTEYTKINWKPTFEELEEYLCELPVVLGHFCITGGEPFNNPSLERLIPLLCRVTSHPMIHIETSGTTPINRISLEARLRGTLWITMSPKGDFLGARKNFKWENIDEVDEVKWIWPGTPLEMIQEALHNWPEVEHYLQPINDKYDINQQNLEDAARIAMELNIPLSLQVHKFVNWR